MKNNDQFNVKKNHGDELEQFASELPFHNPLFGGFKKLYR